MKGMDTFGIAIVSNNNVYSYLTTTVRIGIAIVSPNNVYSYLTITVRMGMNSIIVNEFHYP